MKKILFLLLCLPLSLMAVVKTGDLAPELKLRSVKGADFSPLPIKNAPENSFKILVFTQLRTPMGLDAAILLDEVEKRYRDKNLQVALISLDDQSEMQKFLVDYPEMNYSIMRDESFASATAYLGVNPMLPKGFIVDRFGSVIWDGEATDIPELMENIYSGTFRIDKQKKIAPLLEELRALLRGGDDRRAAELTNEILKIDPTEPSALRIRIFMLESTDRIDQAWQLIDRQIGQTPKLRRNYLSAFELAARYPGFRSAASALTVKYMENFLPDGKYDSAVAWTLLSRYEFNLDAVKAASALLDRLDVDTGTLGEFSARALLAYRLGDLDGAAQFQLKAIELAATSEQREEARSLLDFYQNLAKFGEK